MLCDETKERTADILTLYERVITLVSYVHMDQTGVVVNKTAHKVPTLPEIRSGTALGILK